MTTYYLDLSTAKEMYLTRKLKEENTTSLNEWDIAINLTYISLLYKM